MDTFIGLRWWCGRVVFQSGGLTNLRHRRRDHDIADPGGDRGFHLWSRGVVLIHADAGMKMFPFRVGGVRVCAAPTWRNAGPLSPSSRWLIKRYFEARAKRVRCRPARAAGYGAGDVAVLRTHREVRILIAWLTVGDVFRRWPGRRSPRTAPSRLVHRLSTLL